MTQTPTTEPNVTPELPDNFADIEGSELIRPLKTIKGSDQARVLQRLKGLGIEPGEEVDIESIDFDKLADFIDYIGDNFSLDPAKFEEFTSGSGGFVKAVVLSIGFAGELGKGLS